MPSIKPIEKNVTKVIHSFNIDSVEITLFNSAKIRVALLNEQKHVVEITNIIMEGDEYSYWGNDDYYILNYVSAKLGFTIIY
jgi:cytidylate kinase